MLHFSGIGYIKAGAIDMTIMLVPVIIGAISLGAGAGAVLGGIFGFTVILLPTTQSFFMPMDAVGTVVLCVYVRGIMLGFISGIIFKWLNKLDKQRVWSFEITGMLTALLNTFLFVAGALVIYGNNPDFLSFLHDLGFATYSKTKILTALFAIVGIQAIIEAAICALIAGVAAKAVTTYLKKSG
jgi:uncharacterized membrane protein